MLSCHYTQVCFVYSLCKTTVILSCMYVNDKHICEYFVLSGMDDRVKTAFELLPANVCETQSGEGTMLN